MEDADGGGGGGDRTHWWWASASTAQLGWAIFSLKRGYAGDSYRMPFKAFAVASLFVGAGASAAISLLLASGIHKVEDVLEVGADIRTRLGVHPRAMPEDEYPSLEAHFNLQKRLDKFYQLLSSSTGIQSFLKGDAEAIVGAPGDKGRSSQVSIEECTIFFGGITF